MDENTFYLYVSTEEKTLYEGEAISLFIPGGEGNMEILAYHADMISTIGEGKVMINGKNRETMIFAVSSGFFQMKNNQGALLLESIVNGAKE